MRLLATIAIIQFAIVAILSFPKIDLIDSEYLILSTFIGGTIFLIGFIWLI